MDALPKLSRKYHEWGLRAPRALQRFCRDFGGLNPFGKAMYRLSWAPSQLTWAAGKWGPDHDFQIFAAHIQKYPHMGERWILEHWKTPDTYGSPFEWERNTRQMEEDGQIFDKLGPYPHEGDYECVFHFQTGDTREYVAPTYTLCERRIQEHQRMARKKALLLAMAKADREYEESDKRRVQADILGEAFDGLNGLITPYVSLSGIDVPAASAAISQPAEAGTEVS